MNTCLFEIDTLFHLATQPLSVIFSFDLSTEPPAWQIIFVAFFGPPSSKWELDHIQSSLKKLFLVCHPDHSSAEHASAWFRNLYAIRSFTSNVSANYSSYWKEKIQLNQRQKARIEWKLISERVNNQLQSCIYNLETTLNKTRQIKAIQKQQEEVLPKQFKDSRENQRSEDRPIIYQILPSNWENNRTKKGELLRLFVDQLTKEIPNKWHRRCDIMKKIPQFKIPAKKRIVSGLSLTLSRFNKFVIPMTLEQFKRHSLTKGLFIQKSKLKRWLVRWEKKV